MVRLSRMRTMVGALMVVVVALAGTLCKACEPIDNPGEGDTAIPNFHIFFEQPFTLVLEMTELALNVTNYVKQSYLQADEEGMLVETSAVTMFTEGKYIVYHYFPETNRYIEQYDTECIEPGLDRPAYEPTGWYDNDETHGSKAYGPATILRNIQYEKAEYREPGHEVNGILCEQWYTCTGDNDVEIDFFFSERDNYDMPEKNLFDKDPDIANRIPVAFEVHPENEPLKRVRYTVVEFFPGLLKDSNIETPRGLACEDKVSIAPEKKVPKIPKHFSLAEEVVNNPNIGGIMFGTKQFLEKFEVTYAEELSLVRADFPPIETGDPNDQNKIDKVVHDFNTGVQYAISKEYGTCERGFIPEFSFDQTHSGIGGQGVMAGPDEIFYLDDTYVFVGDRASRELQTDLFTSNRSDLPDPDDFALPYPKAVLEYYFSRGVEVTPISRTPIDMPVRADSFIYNKTNKDEIIRTLTTNFYNFIAVPLYSTDEFSVSECYDKYDDDWSTIYLFFPADEDQFAASEALMNEFKHWIFYSLLAIGDISPTRIGSIDVSDGIAGWYTNTTDSDTIIVTVRLMERAPYFYGYRLPDGDPQQKPGKKEEVFKDSDLESCAELCTIRNHPKCLSFHFCESTCYLSETEGAQGEQTLNVTHCLHYIDNHENQTFHDEPSDGVELLLLEAIAKNEFAFPIKYQDKDVWFNASLSIMLKTPDPMDPIRRQFYRYAKKQNILNPDAVRVIETLDECLTSCVNHVEFRCETVVHHTFSGKCQLYSQHANLINESRFEQSTDAYIHERSYLMDYKIMFGGISLNTTGPSFFGRDPEQCAMECSDDSEFDCNSFEFCFAESQCHLHTETFIDVSGGGDYSVGTSCTHFEKKADKIFTRYPHDGMPNKYHKLVTQLSDVTSCAKLCLDETSPTCQSFDFCTICTEEDVDVCGTDFQGEGVYMCFLGDHHLGEPGLQLAKSVNCEHYSRDLFGDQDYASWIASQRQQDKPYTGGSMAGLAFGMIFLGIILALGTLFIVTKVSPASVPASMGIPLSSGTSPLSAGKPATTVSFKDLSSFPGGESDI